MRCDEFENRLNEILDQRLDPIQDEVLCRHAAQCGSCGQSMDIQLLVIRQLQTDKPTPPISEAEVTKILALGDESEFGSWRSNSRVVFALAVGVLIVCSTIPLLNRFDARYRQTASKPPDVNAERETETSRKPTDALASMQAGSDAGVRSSWERSPVELDASLIPVTFRADWVDLADASQWLAPVPRKLKPLTDSVESAAAILWRTLDGQSSSPQADPQANAAIRPCSIGNSARTHLKKFGLVRSVERITVRPLRPRETDLFKWRIGRQQSTQPRQRFGAFLLEHIESVSTISQIDVQHGSQPT